MTPLLPDLGPYSSHIQCRTGQFTRVSRARSASNLVGEPHSAASIKAPESRNIDADAHNCILRTHQHNDVVGRGTGDDCALGANGLSLLHVPLQLPQQHQDERLKPFPSSSSHQSFFMEFIVINQQSTDSDSKQRCLLFICFELIVGVSAQIAPSGFPNHKWCVIFPTRPEFLLSNYQI